ncbi:MAG TPA: zf-HC2 domain-containing protein [Pyrinomonadaceae bacterium]|nr:zf-HC2 domain-containing protein [Pyrinomonadaceae bacterium]
MIDHLSETEVSLFRERTIDPTERERIDAHVAECQSCLRRILPSDDAALLYSELTEALLPDSAEEPFHLSNVEMSRYTNGSIDEADRVIFESHFDICDQCSEAAQSLVANPVVEHALSSTRQAEISAPQFSPAWNAAFQFTPARAVAAVLVLACVVLAFVVWQRWPGRGSGQTAQQTSSQTSSNTSGGGLPTPTQIPPAKDPTTDQLAVVTSLEDNGRKIQLDNSGKLIGLEELPEASRSLVLSALTTKASSKPEVLEKLTAPPITLMDPTARENTFGLLGPSGTVIETDRPNLRWQALAGATSYTVSVFDADFNLVTRSTPITVTRWTPPSLRRGMIYSWEVVAVRNGQEVRSPVAPAPRAQFRILEAEKLRELTNVKKQSPISHLALGLTYARFGLLAEAEGQLQILARENPSSPVATRLLRTVQEWRKR